MTTRHTILYAALGCSIAATAFGAQDGASPGSGRDAQSDYQVTMTWVSGSNRYAAIDGELYAVGDTLPDGARVLAVESGMVRISRDGTPRLVRIVDKPPSRAGSARDADSRLRLDYLDDAIAEVDRAVEARGGEPGAQTQLDDLNALRDRLVAARDRLAGDELSDAERARIEAELNADWLRAQRKLDLLRRRIAGSGGALGIDELRATQTILEDAALAGLRPPLAQLQRGELEGLTADQPAGLLESVTEVLGSYPDYRALVEQLEQAQSDQAQ